MIERTLVSGRPASVAYIKQDFTPCSKEKAELIRVHWDDGDTAFLVPEKPVYKSVLKYNKCHDPETGRFCSTEGGIPPKVEEALKEANKWLLERQKSQYREGTLAPTETEAAVIVGEDGKVIFKKEGSHNSVQFTEKQVKKMAGGYLTHNHPGTRWPGLSNGDLKLAFFAGLKEIMVCTKDGSVLGASVSTLPNTEVEIDRAYVDASNLVSNIVTERLVSVKGSTKEYWNYRDALGAAESILTNQLLHDTGLINLKIYSRGKAIQDADALLGSTEGILEHLRSMISDVSDLGGKEPSPNDPINYRRWRLNRTATYVSRLNRFAKKV